MDLTKNAETGNARSVEVLRGILKFKHTQKRPQGVGVRVYN